MTPLHVLILLSDAYGGFGGISRYNRDFIEGLCALDAVGSVNALPRVGGAVTEEMPAKLDFAMPRGGGKAGYTVRALRRGLLARRPDLVICGHLNLLPLAVAIARLRGAPLALQLHGVDAWQPTGRTLVDRATAQVDLLLSVSDVTLQRYRRWAAAPRLGSVVLPNTIALEHYGTGPKAADLVARHDLAGRRVLMTMGRLDARERYKGFDEVIALLPRLRERDPAIAYMIVGDGDDADRLRARAAALGIADQVRFTGFVPEDRKADYFRLADAYVMASSGEGFGIVCLEAMACGVPTIASVLDGGIEAVRGGEIGQVVDPRDSDALEAAILAALDRPHAVPDGLAYFARPMFRQRIADLLFAPSSPLAPRLRRAAA